MAASVDEVADRDGVQLLHVVPVLLWGVDEGGQHSRTQVGRLIRSQLAVVDLAEVDVLPVPEDVDGPYQVALVLVVPPRFLGAAHPPLHPHALSPAVVGVLHVLTELVVDLREGHLGGRDGSHVAEGSLEEEGLVLGEHLVEDCQSLLDDLAPEGWFADTVLLVVEASEQVGPDLVVEHSLETDLCVLQGSPQLQDCPFLEEADARP